MAGIHDRDTYAMLQRQDEPKDDGSWPMRRTRSTEEELKDEVKEKPEAVAEQATPVIVDDERLALMGRALEVASTTRPGYWW